MQQLHPTTRQKKLPRLIRPWSIRGQLMLFLCFICLTLLSAVWFLSGQLLQPYYNEMIHHHLEEQVDEIIALMDGMTADGVVISMRTEQQLIINGAFQTAFYQEMENDTIQLSDLCVNIADTSLSYVMYSENIYPCLLHGDFSTIFAEEEITEARDNEEAIYLRNLCFSTGEVYTIVSSGEWQQMVLGKTTADGQYVVFVSASLSQVVDAGIVLQQLAPTIAVIVLLLAALAAWLFSLWFTKPISNLTSASQAMVEGNYDISLAVLREDELGDLTREFNQMAKEVQRSATLQRDLLANVSHDLRTPLTLIRGYAETLRDITGSKKEKRTEQLSIIIDETERLTTLVNSILELSRLSSENATYDPVLFNFSLFCEELVDRYEGICIQNNWTLRLSLPETPIRIYADPAQIERALDNLLGNSMHHIGEDGVFILRASTLPDGTCLVEVEDHGAGIPIEEQRLLFEKYYRSRAENGTVGTGLGLSISRAIFKQHRFPYGVKSTPGKGATFWFIARTQPPSDLPQPKGS